MKSIILSLMVCIFCMAFSQAQTSGLPANIQSGRQGTFHVQGVVVDQPSGYVYFSFTDRLVKTDLTGRIIGSVTGFAGHLGDLDFGADGKIYGSLEYKNDAIGKGIKKELGINTGNEDGFYIAIFDPSKITRPDMNAEKDDLLRTVYIKEAVDDYTAKVKSGDTTYSHRFACSGIDGLAFAPAIGNTDTAKKYLYVAYGIYGDTTRTDNDHQVILKYDVAGWNNYAKPLAQNQLHHSGPPKPLGKYFVKTGNTRYGIQNLAYDPFTGNLFAAVYHGTKRGFPNYDLFVIDGKKKPETAVVFSGNQKVKVQTLSLLNDGLKDSGSGIRGWFFKWGSTGLCPLGNGTFYISHDAKTKDGQQQSTLTKYRWTGDDVNPFSIE